MLDGCLDQIVERRIRRARRIEDVLVVGQDQWSVIIGNAALFALKAVETQRFFSYALDIELRGRRPHAPATTR